MKKFQHIGLVAIATLAMMSCGSSKQTQNNGPSLSETYAGKTIELPCSGKNKSDKEYYRQLGVGKDTELSIAQANALKNAKDLLLKRLGGMVVGLSTNYSKTYQKSGRGDDLEGIVESELTTAVKKALEDADNACEQAAVLPTGEIQYYYVIEVQKQDLAGKMAKAISETKNYALTSTATSSASMQKNT
ncbi:MAG: hypothetical protein ACSW8I_02090 [bacterium]